jgi:hypothetical protein
MSVELHNLVEHLDGDVVNGFDVGEQGADDILHPLVIRGTQRSMPVVEHSELDRHMTASTSLDTRSALLNFLPKVE